MTALTTVQEGKGPAKDSVLLGKYRVEGTLGFGGMGIVIAARNIALDERVAIKFLREDVNLDGEHVERFLREAKNAVRLKSEHVAKIRDVGKLEDGRPYMVMELLEGLDLGKLLLDHGAIEPPRAVDLILQACDALAEAHALGIIHRDIKPTNLFISLRRDESELLKVLDFGISKASGPELSLTQTSSMLGTPAYMSPEQMRSARTADPRSDIWALGTVLYELVEGRLPFDASNFAELCVMVSTEDPSPMTKAPHLQALLTRCLAKPLEERYQDMGDLAVDLEPFSSDPTRARRQVARIHRVLGKSGPASRDSTPLPMSRDSMQRLPYSRDGVQRITGTSAAAVAPVSGGAWKSILLLLLLFGVGIAGGLYVTSGGADSQPAAEVPDDAGHDATAVEIPPDAPAADPVDAGTETGSNAIAPAEGSGSATPIKRPPPKKQPPRKQPPPPKKQPTAGSGAGSAAPTPTPPKKCDPFASPKGCK